MFDQIQNNLLEKPGKQDKQQQQIIHSCCSIEQQQPKLTNRRVKFNYWQQPGTKKSQKAISDRYLPIRGPIGSQKQLMVEQDNQLIEQEFNNLPNQNKQFTVASIYRRNILKDGIGINKDNQIQTFSNNNLFRFTGNDEQNIKSQKRILSKNFIPIQQQNITTKSKILRKINKIPTKVLDAPALYDDFYLNLLDWSTSNLLSVGLSNSVYIWNAGNSKVVRLVQLSQNDLVTGTSSSPTSNNLGVGTHSGQLQIWDCIKNKKTLTFGGHHGRVGAIAWNNNNVLASGSRDKTILIRDIRVASQFVSRLTGHKQQVCGLKWSPDQQQLASGGNDNKLNVWSIHSTIQTGKFLKHTAAVKALAWSPHQHGLLASGGGTADRTIRFWNTMTNQQTRVLDVGSQVCNLMFARNVNQLISTHGYSLNQINIWTMPKMQKIQTLTGHTFRVLYLAMSPDGTTIVTGAGDQTLRFWNIFPKKQNKSKTISKLYPQSIYIR